MNTRTHLRKCVILTALALSLVIGCTQSPVISVEIDPPSGHPCPSDGGLYVRVFCTGGEPPYIVTFGDGMETTSRTGVAEHVYRPPYTETEYRVTASCEAGVGFADLVIENQPPVFYDIFSVRGNQAEEGEFVLLQVNHFAKGCDDCDVECEPYRLYGGFDPDGDALYYEWHIRREGSAKEDSVYDLSGNRVNGQAVQGDYFVWFPKWQETKPPWPFSPLPSVSTANAEPTNGAGWVDEREVAHPMGNYHSYRVQLIVTDYCGAADAFETTWEILEHDR